MVSIDKVTKLITSSNIRHQVILSFLLKGASVCLSLVVIPATLSLLTTEKYGIWITLQSIFSWIVLFDIGVGNGLRNKLTESLAKKNILESRVYISTAYFIISLIGLVLIILLVISVNFVNWQDIFKSKVLNNLEYIKLILISLLSLIICFVLGLINQIFNSFQKNWLTNVISIISNILFLSFIIVFRNIIKGDLILIATVYCTSLIFSYVSVSIVFFYLNPKVIPSIKHIQRNRIADILKLGGGFFIIQIAVLLIFSIDNFLILQLLGASEVTEYNIVYKLFSIFNISFGIILGPLWSAYTVAYVKKDIIWIKNILRKLQLIMIPTIIALIILCCFFNKILQIWLPHNKIINPHISLLISMALFVVINYWNSIYSYYLNGISKTKMQIITAVIGAIINIPLAISLVKHFNLGLTGIILSMIASLSLFSVLGPILTYKTLREMSNG